MSAPFMGLASCSGLGGLEKQIVKKYDPNAPKRYLTRPGGMKMEHV